MRHRRVSPGRWWRTAVPSAVALAALLGVLGVVGVPVTYTNGFGPATARADTSPPAGVPATASAKALPTWQINGVGWAQVVVGNTVYVTGSFTTARPPGVAVGGPGQVTQTDGAEKGGRWQPRSARRSGIPLTKI